MRSRPPRPDVSQEGAKLWGHLTTNAYAGYARPILGELFEDNSMWRKSFGKCVLPVPTVLCKRVHPTANVHSLPQRILWVKTG
jgi:hypothetical protein